MLVALLSLTALCLLAVSLALALFHVRYRATWNGTWNGLAATDDPAFPNAGAFRLEIGFPGFMKPLTKSPAHGPEGPTAADSATAETPAQTRPSAPQDAPSSAARSAHADNVSAVIRSSPADPVRSSGPLSEAAPGATSQSREPEASAHGDGKREARAARAPRAGRDPNRLRRALFRVATDGPAWKLLRRFVKGAARRAFRLSGLRIAVAVGHPDPARLGRAAGAWHAVAPLMPLPRGLAVEFRFQDQRPTLGVRAEGAFSALSLLAFGGAVIVSFPWIGLGRRAWHGWRNSTLTGWRAWTYAKIQKL